MDLMPDESIVLPNRGDFACRRCHARSQGMPKSPVTRGSATCLSPAEHALI